LVSVAQFGFEFAVVGHVVNEDQNASRLSLAGGQKHGGGREISSSTSNFNVSEFTTAGKTPGLDISPQRVQGS
jgi:hypothetical protein